MFPRIKTDITDDFNKVVLNLYTENYSIEINKEKCIGCGLCIKACPNNAFSHPNLEGKIRVKTIDLIPDAPDALKCSYCGTCSYICPTSAILLKHNNKLMEQADLGIVIKNVVPKIEYKTVESKKNQIKIRIYLDGKIDVDWEKCISCMSCVDVCPSNAFLKLKNLKNNSTKRKISYNETKCIRCGTCVRACSRKAIKLTINKLKYSGNYKKIFWESLLKRIMTE
ncbi:MAG: 4Fe-4S binding protein [Promethearchaeota archaeon]